MPDLIKIGALIGAIIGLFSNGIEGAIAGTIVGAIVGAIIIITPNRTDIAAPLIVFVLLTIIVNEIL